MQKSILKKQNSIPLQGCRTTPLMSYLKALGILRLISEQTNDSQIRGCWKNNIFHLQTQLDENEIFHFFINEYKPTPIVAPWNGGSGFFPKDNQYAISTIESSTINRLDEYRSTILQCRNFLKENNIISNPSNDKKQEIRRFCRINLPDSFVCWIDAAIVIAENKQIYFPIFGTGGNDGRLEFTQNFMQRLLYLQIHQDKQNPEVESWLKNALWNINVNNLLSESVGQFDPGKAGGLNATQGTKGTAIINPWNYILMIEGALLLAGSVSKRMTSNPREKAVFPFTVTTSASGYGSSSNEEENTENSRGEVWLPLWENSASLSEIQHLFSEGRSECSRRPSYSGIDFARSVSSLGIDRGISSFIRYEFLRRSGDSHFATPVGNFQVSHNPETDLLKELEKYGWLDKFRKACNGKNVPPRFPTTLRLLDSTIFDYCRYGEKIRFQKILCALGRIERELSCIKEKPGMIGNSPPINPVPLLSQKWIKACNDNSSEFNIALALASLLEEDSKKIGSFRSYLEPVEYNKNYFKWSETNKSVVWSSTNLHTNLLNVLIRRIIDTERSGVSFLPMKSQYSATLKDIASFYKNSIDESKLEELLWGLILIRFNKTSEMTEKWEKQISEITYPYALLKLLFAELPLKTNPEKTVYHEPSVLWLLKSNQFSEACTIAERRLRASGYDPKARNFRVKEELFENPSRIASSLIIPVNIRIRNLLANLALRNFHNNDSSEKGE